MFGGAILLMAITCVTVVAIGRAQVKGESPEMKAGPMETSQV